MDIEPKTSAGKRRPKIGDGRNGSAQHSAQMRVRLNSKTQKPAKMHCKNALQNAAHATITYGSAMSVVCNCVLSIPGFVRKPQRRTLTIRYCSEKSRQGCFRAENENEMRVRHCVVNQTIGQWRSV
jgi:hypothetical protein